LSPGVLYTFKILARNSYGSGAYSSEITILSAQVPEKPEAPVTSVAGNNVVIDWIPPLSGGNPISSYTIYIMKND
jgi:hypothetical protein